VPYLGLGLIVFGIMLIIVNYSFPGVLPTKDWTLLLGFVLMGGGLGVLSQWR
jgi:predicted acyltransferase